MENLNRKPRTLIRIGAVISMLLAVPVMWAIPGGVPISPLVTLDPDNLDFGRQVARQTSTEKRVTVKNSGDAPLSVDSVEIRGDDPNSFAITNDTCSGAKVDPDRSCIVDVTFTPSGTGDRTARLRINDNAPENPHRVSLKGKGINAVDVQPF